MASVKLGKTFTEAIKKATKVGVEKSKIHKILEVSGLAVSIGVGTLTLWRSISTSPVDEAMLQKRIDELKLVDKDLDKKIATTVAKIETLTAERQAEIKKDKYIQFGIIGGLFAILGTLIYFVMSDRKRRHK